MTGFTEETDSMSIFEKAVPRYPEVKVSVAGEMFSLRPRDLYHLIDGAKTWGALAGFVEGGEIMQGLHERPTWARDVIEFDPATFRAEPPPPAPRNSYLTAKEIEARHGVNPANALEFPTATRQRMEFNTAGVPTATIPLWNSARVQAWAEKVASMAVPRV
jgi:hypothetical protein